ncbi:MAG: flagellar assembly protein FliW [Candidatus Poribacteria bacterium]|nr:flagellar assembly protein FliW [Candidatus Poribacteria bacterium]
MKVRTTRFGQITVEESGVITLPAGILGFVDRKRYTFIEVDEYVPLKWFQSLDESWLAFVLVDPDEFLEEYDVQIDSECASELDLSSQEDARVYVIVTASERAPDATANLQAPIILNPTKQLAKQVILMNSPYSVRHPVLGTSQ